MNDMRRSAKIQKSYCCTRARSTGRPDFDASIIWSKPCSKHQIL